MIPHFVCTTCILLNFASVLYSKEFCLEKVPALMRKHRVPGAAIAVVKNSEIVAVEYFGFHNREENIKMDSSSLFQIGSISKTFAAWGILKLVEQGLVDLDKPIETYLSSWHLTSSTYDISQVTVRRVLNHTAGLSVPSYYGYFMNSPQPSTTASLNGIPGSHHKLEVLAPPGHGFEYSGGGYTLLQQLIEDVSGESFQNFMLSHLFLPLHLHETTYFSSDENNVHLCNCYNTLGKQLVPLCYTESAAAGLYSTINDLAHFTKHTLELYASPIQSVLCSGSLKEMIHANETSYTLGYDVEILPNGTSLVFHEGANPGWRSGMYLLPSLSSGLAILTNSDRGMWLIEDIVKDWLESETGDSSAKFKSISEKRLWVNLSTGALWVIWVGYLCLFLTNYRFKKWYQKPSYIPLALWLFLGLGWYTLFYTPIIYGLFHEGKWIIGSFLPAGFDRLTWVVLIWSLTGLGASFRSSAG